MRDFARLFDDNPLIQEVAEAFLSSKRAGKRSPETVEFYDYYLAVLLAYCKRAGLRYMTEWTPAHARAHLESFGYNHKPGGAHALFRTLRAFGYWYEKQTDGAWRSPMRYIEAPKVPNDPIPGASIPEIQAMIAACGPGWYGRRDRALLMFLLDTGVRSGELTALNAADVDLHAKAVLVRAETSKGYKSRIVYFSDDTALALKRYLRGRGELAPNAPFWLNRYGERLEYDCLDSLLTRLAKRAKLSHAPSPHDFRRACALSLLRSKVDLLTVSKLLGHENLETTKRYLALVDEDLERSFRAAPPSARLREKQKL